MCAVRWGYMAVGTKKIIKPENALDGVYYDPKAYMRGIVELFEHLRGKLGWEIEFLHDVHERLSPIDAVAFAKQMEPFRLFYLEDALPPEQIEWYRTIRQHTVTPIAMGELFNNPNEWLPLMSNRLIDFIRVHVSQVGGITPVKKNDVHGRGFRHPHCVARAGRCFSGRSCRKRAFGHKQHQFRYSGVERIQGRSLRSILRMPRRKRRICISE